jgi:hypothetical protein
MSDLQQKWNIFKPDDKLWHQQYEKLVEFKRKKGHCLVPKRYEQDTRLGEWVNKQRRNHVNDTMRLERKRLLDEIGFVWKVEGDRNIDINDKVWHQQYEKLVEFKRTNGHCRVPNRYDRDKSLGTWVSEQRKNHNNNKMRPDREKLLDEIGFVWKADNNATTFIPDSKLWHQQFEKLVEFKRKKGHCIVPTKYEQDRSLAKWVSTQRSFHINNKIRLDRKKVLDEIGFVWKVEGNRNRDINDKVWHQQYEKLVEFKRKKGHCLVPRKYEQDRSLGHWVRNQRTSHIDNKIRLDRKKLLDEIEFVWKGVTGCPARYSTSSSSVGLPNEALIEEPEQEAQAHNVRNRFECPSRNRKRPRTCLADGGEMAARTNQNGKTTTGSCSCVEEDVGGLDEEDSNPSLVTSTARIGSDPGQEVVQEEEATTLCEIPSGWARVKLEPDC